MFMNMVSLHSRPDLTMTCMHVMRIIATHNIICTNIVIIDYNYLYNLYAIVCIKSCTELIVDVCSLSLYLPISLSLYISLSHSPYPPFSTNPWLGGHATCANWVDDTQAHYVQW